MIYKIILSDEAKINLKESSLYYKKISTKLDDRFKKDFVETLEKIKENPFHFQIRYREVRIAFCINFPFGIHYSLYDNEIVIHFVLHTKRDF